VWRLPLAISRIVSCNRILCEAEMSTDQDWSQLWPDQDWIVLQFFWKLEDQDRIWLTKLFLYLCDYSEHIKILVVIRFYRFAKWECNLPWMAKALLRQFCNSNCIHLCEHITLSSSSNVNIVEWLVSIPAVQVFVDGALSICFGPEWSDVTFDANAFCVAYFLNV